MKLFLGLIKDYIVNDLTTGGSTVPLSAEQGKTLNTNKVNVSDIKDNLTSNTNADKSKPLSAYQGYTIKTDLDKKTSVATYDEVIAGSNTKALTPAQAESMLSMDFTITNLNEDGRPLTIEYSNGQTVNITYRSDGQIEKYTTLGYTVTFNYNSDDYLISKVTTKD